MLPELTTCVICQAALTPQDHVIPLYEVVEPKTNPWDVTDQGIELLNRVHFAHRHCQHRTSPLET